MARGARILAQVSAARSAHLAPVRQQCDVLDTARNDCDRIDRPRAWLTKAISGLVARKCKPLKGLRLGRIDHRVLLGGRRGYSPKVVMS